MGIFKTSDGALFVQPEGPNTQPRFVGCVDVDQLSEPGGAIDTLIRCFKPDGSGWYTLDSTVTPPDPVTTTITTIVEGAANYLEQLESGLATLFIHQRLQSLDWVDRCADRFLALSHRPVRELIRSPTGRGKRGAECLYVAAKSWQKVIFLPPASIVLFGW